MLTTAACPDLYRLARERLRSLAHLDVSLQRGAMDGIGPIASPSPDGRANRRKRGHIGRRLNIAQAYP
jgi:hypothetical protein